MNETKEKYSLLESKLKQLGKVAIAYSSGVDSTFLLKTAHCILGDNAVAITAKAPCFMKRESQEADEFCKKEGIRQITVDFNPLEIEEFKSNVKNRCYFCKSALFTKIKEVAAKNGFNIVADGTNADDLNDFRPGMKALEELGIISPLLESGLTKEEIRILSKDMGLSTFNKPSYACLASRIAYNEEITEKKLQMVEKAEERLFELGFIQSRVRMHGNLARIEINKNGFSELIAVSDELNAYFKSLGFSFVSLDLNGYKTGSMNI